MVHRETVPELHCSSALVVLMNKSHAPVQTSILVTVRSFPIRRAPTRCSRSLGTLRALNSQSRKATRRPARNHHPRVEGENVCSSKGVGHNDRRSERSNTQRIARDPHDCACESRQMPMICHPLRAARPRRDTSEGRHLSSPEETFSNNPASSAWTRIPIGRSVEGRCLSTSHRPR
jgi:hypothetical protein